jgi:hypothetical protein
MPSLRVVTMLLLFVLGAASLSQAQQVQRTFVSGSGNDGNPCSRAAPCRSFAQAVSQTNPGGEVIALDSAGYGPFGISQSVTVQAAPGVYAGISVFSGDGIAINAGSSDIVTLRGLTVNAQGGQNGIVQITGGTLHIEECVVNGFSSGIGIAFNGPGDLHVTDSTVKGNNDGISIASSASRVATGTIENVRLKQNATNGLIVKEASFVTIRNSVSSKNGDAGVLATSSSSISATVNVENCLLNRNFNGIRGSGAGAIVRVSNSTVTDNVSGLVNDNNTASVLSRGNNTIEGNLARSIGTIGSFVAQ